MIIEMITGIACFGIVFIVVSVVWTIVIVQKPQIGEKRKSAACKKTTQTYANACEDTELAANGVKHL